VKPADQSRREFLNAVIPQRMVVENPVTGAREVLTFSADRYAAAGYVPDVLRSSGVIGLFLMSDASYRLADKLGNQFHFDQAGCLTDMFLSPHPEHHVHIEYVDGFTEAFEEAPYMAKPADEERIQFLNAMIPKRVKVTDLVHDHSEVLTFNDQAQVAGYVPEHDRTSRFQLLALLSNAGLQLLDRHGNETRFDPGWRFQSVLPSRDRRLVRSMSMGGQRVTFRYTVDHDGEVVIATAALSEDGQEDRSTCVVRYDYDEQGRLCRVRRPEPSIARLEHEAKNALAMAAD
jgi:YD repeat-containing protein